VIVTRTDVNACLADANTLCGQVTDLTSDAQTAYDDKVAQAVEAQAVADATVDYDAAKQALADAITTAETTYTGSEGKVLDEQLRVDLRTQLDAAIILRDAVIATTSEEIITQTEALTAALEPLNTANQAVADNQAAWEAAQVPTTPAQPSPPRGSNPGGGNGGGGNNTPSTPSQPAAPAPAPANPAAGCPLWDATAGICYQSEDEYWAANNPNWCTNDLGDGFDPYSC
jgi:hypothetical protein